MQNKNITVMIGDWLEKSEKWLSANIKKPA